MFRKRFYYLIKVQYLGYRFHGWQKQPELKTLEYMIQRTLKFVLGEQRFKILGAGRTDAKVSANQAAFELFLEDNPLEDTDEFLNAFNTNLPQDIRALSITEVNEKFNIIHDSNYKEYWYHFAYGDKFHPFCAPIMTTILDDLDIALMTKGATLFEGQHNFKAYCYKASDDGEYVRTIDQCQLVENTMFQANFFPERSYLLKVRGKGFGRNQIRLMMGALIKLGRHEISLEDIKRSLQNEGTDPMDFIAPASGLILHKIEFDV